LNAIPHLEPGQEARQLRIPMTRAVVFLYLMVGLAVPAAAGRSVVASVARHTGNAYCKGITLSTSYVGQRIYIGGALA
jgi:hypothetical protein